MPESPKCKGGKERGPGQLDVDWNWNGDNVPAKLYLQHSMEVTISQVYRPIRALKSLRGVGREGGREEGRRGKKGGEGIYTQERKRRKKNNFSIIIMRTSALRK